MKSDNELQDNTNDNNDKKINRREALTRAGCLTLSAATMMVLMKSQPAKAASANQALMAKPNTAPTEVWQRTTRN